MKNLTRLDIVYYFIGSWLLFYSFLLLRDYGRYGGIQIVGFVLATIAGLWVAFEKPINRFLVEVVGKKYDLDFF
ncbi:hypothetical protein [Nostoc sp.]|uniref:hypothetical protein n=1 Tax=Nostoc sp. TaxID=1180 RepID=UPI002FFC5530